MLGFPRSGERFEGVASSREWRRRHPAEVGYELQRLRGSGDVRVAELPVRYDGGTRGPGVDVLEFRDGSVVSGTIYVDQGSPAPDRRAPYRGG